MTTPSSTLTPDADERERIKRLAYGYELLHTAICHMAGTSGAEGRWYMHKAQEVQNRVSPVWGIKADSNPAKPGDCLRNYLSAVPNFGPATPAIRDQAFEEAAKVADRYFAQATARQIADAIRALKGTPPSSVDGELDAMHETARELGYPPILEALEDLDRLKSSPSPDLLKELLEAGEPLSNFAWSAVTADCKESREYLQSLIDNFRAALLKARRPS